MDLLYKPDWEETRDRFETWWAHDCFGRCAIAVTAPRDPVPTEEPPPVPETVEDRWLNTKYIAALNDYVMRHTFYGGEALPVWNPGYPGWATIAAFLGCPVTLQETTGWLDPIINDDDLTEFDYRTLVIQPDNEWWMLAQKMLRFGAQEAKGKSLLSIGAFGGCGDTLAWLRGTGRLLYDVLDCPDYVREFEEYLMRQWFDVYDTFYDIVSEAADGSTCWFTLWSPGKFYAAQNDFSYMISPRLFEEIFIPIIEMQTEYLDHTIYHVDGVNAFVHIDALCELPRLQALQILPGTGKPSPLYYMDVLKKVQAHGKNLHISIPANEVEDALANLSAKGLFIETWCTSEEEARQLLKNAEKWSKDRKVVSR